MAQFDQKILSHFLLLDPLVSDWSLWYNGKNPTFPSDLSEINVFLKLLKVIATPKQQLLERRYPICLVNLKVRGAITF